MPTVHNDAPYEISHDSRFVVLLPNKRPRPGDDLPYRVGSTSLHARLVHATVEALARVLSQKQYWDLLPGKGLELHVGIWLEPEVRSNSPDAEIVETIGKQFGEMLVSQSQRLPRPISLDEGFGWFLWLGEKPNTPPQMPLRVLASRLDREGDTENSETLVDDSFETWQDNRVRASAAPGKAPSVVQDYIASAKLRLENATKRLQSQREVTQRELDELFDEKGLTFRATESGYSESFDLVNAIHIDAIACGCVPTWNDQPILLRRLLPPAMNGRRQTQFIMHDYLTGAVVHKPTSKIPALHYQPFKAEHADEVFGCFELVRQQMIEAFRRKLCQMAGDRLGKPSAVKQLKKDLNNARHRLGVGFGYADNDSVFRVMLISSSSSFQLRKTTQGGGCAYSGTDFPQLYLIDEHISQFK